jgi:hypothetical protein
MPHAISLYDKSQGFQSDVERRHSPQTKSVSSLPLPILKKRKKALHAVTLTWI